MMKGEEERKKKDPLPSTSSPTLITNPFDVPACRQRNSYLAVRYPRSTLHGFLPVRCAQCIEEGSHLILAPAHLPPQRPLTAVSGEDGGQVSEEEGRMGKKESMLHMCVSMQRSAHSTHTYTHTAYHTAQHTTHITQHSTHSISTQQRAHRTPHSIQHTAYSAQHTAHSTQHTAHIACRGRFFLS